MKILFVTHYSFLLGSNRSLESLVTYFRKKNVEVSVLMPSKGLFYEHLMKNGVDVHRFPFFFESLYVKLNKKYLSLPLLWLYNFFAFFFLCGLVKRINPDVIYSNSSADGYSIHVARWLGLKHVMHVREFMQEDFGARYLWGKRCKRRKILKSDKIVFVSKSVAAAVVGQLPSYGTVVYNGLKIPQVETETKLLRDDLKIGIVGNIDVSKQQHLLIEFMPDILEKYPQITLHIVGDKNCPYKQKLLNMVRDLQLQNNVFFDGFIKDTDEIYSKFDVLAMCSRSEAFGRVTIEAMLRNKPVIGLDVAGTSELIHDGVTGYKFSTKESFISALNDIVENPQKQKAIIRDAKLYAVKYFSEDRYCEDVYNFIISDNWRKKEV